MAKVKSAGLRNYVGRLGGSVYYMNKGQNIGRELAPEVSNPRTPAQMRQRMKWANLVNVYKANRSWMGHLSFETKPQTWSDYNAFMSANIGANPVYLTKGAAENGDAVLAPYTMTKGSLPTIDYDYAVSIEGIETSIKITSNPALLTVGELAQEILDNNSEWQFGDQLSIVLMYKGVAPFPIVVPIELVLDTNDDTTIANIETRFATLDNILAKTDDGYLAVKMAVGVNFGNQAACVIHSRTISGRTYVSTQAFVLNVTAMLAFQQMGTDQQFQYAAASYGLGADFFLAAGYQDTQGGGGGGSIIRSFTGVYEPDETGETDTFTIVDGGTNTFNASVDGAIDNSTRLTLIAREALTASDYSLWFTPTGGQRIGVGVAASPSGLTLSISVLRANALQVEGKAGLFELVDSDAYEDGEVVATWNVTWH